MTFSYQTQELDAQATIRGWRIGVKQCKLTGTKSKKIKSLLQVFFLFLFFFFFLILFLSSLFLLSNLLCWFCMKHSSDWLKNFTEMALDIKSRYLCLSLWAQFCTPSCLFHSSDSAFRALHRACLALTWLISNKYFGHRGFRTHGRKTFW